jgi:hypothetical protein
MMSRCINSLFFLVLAVPQSLPARKACFVAEKDNGHVSHVLALLAMAHEQSINMALDCSAILYSYPPSPVGCSPAWQLARTTQEQANHCHVHPQLQLRITNQAHTGYGAAIAVDIYPIAAVRGTCSTPVRLIQSNGVY